MTKPLPFRGKGLRMANAAKWVADQDYFFVRGTSGAIVEIPAGAEITQFEGLNFGWTKVCDEGQLLMLDRS